MQFSRHKAEALRTAWHGPLSADEIAKRHRVASAQTLRNFWQREKAAGRLPQNKARPHFEVHTTLPPAPVPIGLGIDPVDIDLDDGADAVPDAGAALTQLYRFHGADRLRGINDEMPAHLIEIERRDTDQHYTPSPARVIDFQRGRDAYARSKMAVPPAPSNCFYARVGHAWWMLRGLAMVAGPFLAFGAAQEWVRKFGAVHTKAKA